MEVPRDIDKLLKNFWAKIHLDPSGCWLWAGALTEKGYGAFGVNGKKKRAHRVAYELFVDEIPKNRCLDHLCRIRHCVNPAHLESVTYKENIRRGRGPRRRGRCRRGHQMTPETTYTRPDGYTECRTYRKLKRQSPPPSVDLALLFSR